MTLNDASRVLRRYLKIMKFMFFYLFSISKNFRIWRNRNAHRDLSAIFSRFGLELELWNIFHGRFRSIKTNRVFCSSKQFVILKICFVGRNCELFLHQVFLFPLLCKLEPANWQFSLYRILLLHSIEHLCQI